MTTFYHENDSRYEFIEPQLTRWRSRYRGQRESLKLNTESNQFSYDVKELYRQIFNLRSELESFVSLIVSGGEVDALYNSDNVEIEGIEDMMSNLDDMLVYLRMLEH